MIKTINDLYDLPDPKFKIGDKVASIGISLDVKIFIISEIVLYKSSDKLNKSNVKNDNDMIYIYYGEKTMGIGYSEDSIILLDEVLTTKFFKDDQQYDLSIEHNSFDDKFMNIPDRLLNNDNIDKSIDHEDLMKNRKMLRSYLRNNVQTYYEDFKKILKNHGIDLYICEKYEKQNLGNTNTCHGYDRYLMSIISNL